MSPRPNGFTLIELMVTVALLAVILAVAVPSYQHYVVRANRIEGMALLSKAAIQQERYFAQNHAYLTNQSEVAKLGIRMSGTDAISDNALYHLELQAGTSDNGGYLLTAVAQGRQQSDAQCANLTLDATGTSGTTGTGPVTTCWR